MARSARKLSKLFSQWISYHGHRAWEEKWTCGNFTVGLLTTNVSRCRGKLGPISYHGQTHPFQKKHLSRDLIREEKATWPNGSVAIVRSPRTPSTFLMGRKRSHDEMSQSPSTHCLAMRMKIELVVRSPMNLVSRTLNTLSGRKMRHDGMAPHN